MTDDPQDSRRPFSLSYPSNSSSKQRHAVFQGQVRAFLEASEIVEMGEEVLDDILDGFDGFDHETSDCVTDEQPFIPVRTLVRDAVGNIELPLPHGFYVYFGPQGMPFSALLPLDICSYVEPSRRNTPSPLDHMVPRWTKQQIKGMLVHLKQRGKCSFCGSGPC
jgi:hypothetical protein